MMTKLCIYEVKMNLKKKEFQPFLLHDPVDSVLSSNIERKIQNSLFSYIQSFFCVFFFFLPDHCLAKLYALYYSL